MVSDTIAFQHRFIIVWWRFVMGLPEFVDTRSTGSGGRLIINIRKLFERRQTGNRRLLLKMVKVVNGHIIIL